MGRRIIVPSAQCTVCSIVETRSGAAVFAAGYVAGVHRVSRGDAANENVCLTHATLLDEAVARYVAKGIKP